MNFEAWNFGPRDEDCKSVRIVLDKIVKMWGDGVAWSIDENNNPHEAGILKLDCSKAKLRLKWNPRWGLNHTLKLIVEWHKNYLNGGDIKENCLKKLKDMLNNGK